MNHLRVAFAPYWQSIQHALFPQLERVLGPLTEKQQQLVQTLEVIRIEQMIPRRFRVPGRPPKDRAAMARALVAKAVYDMPTTRVLLDRLDTDVVLRRICGWERRSEVPSESVFSRAFAEFSDTQLPQRVHEALIWNTHRDRLVGHLSRDSTAIEDDVLAAGEEVEGEDAFEGGAVEGSRPVPVPVGEGLEASEACAGESALDAAALSVFELGGDDAFEHHGRAPAFAGGCGDEVVEVVGGAIESESAEVSLQCRRGCFVRWHRRSPGHGAGRRGLAVPVGRAG